MKPGTREGGSSGPGHLAMGPATATLAHGLVATVSSPGLGQVMRSCLSPGAHATDYSTSQAVETQEPGAEPEPELTSVPTAEDEC